MISPALRRGVTLVMFAALFCAALTAVPSAGAADYPGLLVERALRMRLHEQREWEVLLHYRRTLLGEYRSRIADPAFFLSPQGRTAPAQELQATIRSLFLPASRDGEHVACRFPARFDFLRRTLSIDPAALPPYTCSDRDRLFETVDPKSAVLVFPVGHINSPASMFGHTLLRIDGPSRSNLISYAANYAAVTTDANGFIYAWKGIFGGYRGYYSLLPYYLKVKEYGDLEHRDIWEYPLKLSEREVRKMLSHLWELQTIYSDYYFFDENCSFNLLFLIEAGRPELHLTEKTGPWVIPSDTIEIAAEAGILEPARYRPSQGTRIRQAAAQLSPRGQEKAYQLAYLDPIGTSSGAQGDEEQGRVLDLAAELLQYRFGRKELEKDIYTQRYRRVLARRSRLGELPSAEAMPTPDPPEAGHRSLRVGTGVGVRRGAPYLELRMQPGYHSLLDPDQGYLRGAQIKLMEGEVLYDVNRENFQLKSLHLVDILSLAPRDRFFRPLSWKVKAGLEREAMRDGRDAVLFKLNTGGGIAYATPFNGIAYALGEIEADGGDKIRAAATVGPAATVGVMEQVGERWKVQLYLRGALFEVGDDRKVVEVGVNQGVRVTRNNSISLELCQQFVNGRGVFEGTLFWNRYF